MIDMKRLFENTGALAFLVTLGAYWQYFDMGYVETACVLLTYCAVHYVISEIRGKKKQEEEEV